MGSTLNNGGVLVLFGIVLVGLRLILFALRNPTVGEFPQIRGLTIDLPIRIADLQHEWDSLQSGEHLVLPNALTRSIPVDDDDEDVTLSVHLSPSTKLPRFLFLLNRWNGPSSVAIYISDPEEIPTFIDFCKANMGNPNFLKASFHVILSKDSKLPYPQNRMRELSVQFVRGPFLALDVDFITQPDCHTKLKALIRNDAVLADALKSRTIFVLPAFNYEKALKDEDLRDDMVPNKKEEAISMVKRGELTGFHMAEFEAGQKPTNYSKWYSHDDGKSFFFIEYGMKFEPYVLAYRDDNGNLPHYWEEFRGFGYDKYSWFMELYYAGYKFATLNDFFVIHLQHEYSYDKSVPIPLRNSLHMEKFMSYLKTNYGATDEELMSVANTVKWAKGVAQKQQHRR